MVLLCDTKNGIPVIIGKPFPGSQATVEGFTRSLDEHGRMTKNPIIVIGPMITTIEYARAYAETILSVCDEIQPCAEPCQSDAETPTSLQHMLVMPF